MRKLLLLGFVFFVGCATTMGQYKVIKNDVARGDYAVALAKLEKSKDKAYKAKDRVLYYLEAGFLAHYAGQYEKSNDYLSKADIGMQENTAKSISRTIASYLANDNVLEYAGEDYELIYLHFFMALNYLHLDKFEDSLVEIRRIDQELNNLKNKYNQANQTILTSEEARENSDVIMANMPKGQRTFYSSVAAHYLSMLYWIYVDKMDEARVDQRLLLAAYQGQRNLYNFPLDTQNIDKQLILPDDTTKQRVHFFAYTNKILGKTAVTFRLPFPQFYLKITVPELHRTSAKITRIVVENHDQKLELSPIESVQNIAVDTFKDKAQFTYLKTVMRAFGKATASAVATQAVKHSNARHRGLATFATALAGIIAIEVSEQADLRSTQLLPTMIHTGSLDLPEGIHEITVTYYDTNNNVVATETKSLTIDSNKMYIVELTKLI